MIPIRPLVPLLIIALLSSSSARAGKELEGIAARSVHLNYHVPEGEWFHVEARVDETQPGTYVCTAGFEKGYFGMQDLGRGRKVLIFSVWDPGDPFDFSARPDQVAKDRQVENLYADPAARIKRFGGEGTGGQCLIDFDWKTGEWYRFAVHAQPEGKTTIYTAFVVDPAIGGWRRLASFRAKDDGGRLDGAHSFVEDFRRNRVSATQVRTASFRRVGSVDAAAAWHPATRARFTGDGNPSVNIDAGARDGAFFLATGGSTTNAHVRLWGQVRLERAPGDDAAPDLPPRPTFNEEPKS
ncbi:MAG: DUF3472 domain-containing protein [Kiritimatiellia bacterium]